MSTPMPATRESDPNRAAPPEAAAALHALRISQAEQHAAVAQRLHRLSRGCGALRLLLFTIAALLTVRAATAGGTGTGMGALGGALAFAALVVWHGRVMHAERRAAGRAALARESAARLAGAAYGPGTGASLPDDPISALDAGQAVHAPEPAAHALDGSASADLGVEGESPSLHALLDTTQTELGGRRLRYMLRHPLLDPGAIRARQEAVAEFASERALRDDLLLEIGPSRPEVQRRLPAFLATPRLLYPGAWSFAALLCGATCLPLLVLAGWFPACGPFAAVSLGGVLLLRFSTRRRTAFLRDAYLEMEPLVLRALGVARRLEPASPRSSLLATLRTLCLENDARDQPVRLRAIAWRLRMLHLQELGFLGSLAQLLTLWDVHWLVGLEARVKHASGRFERLAGALADLEALIALGVYADEQPGVVFPEIVASGPPELALVGGEHPLLRVGTAVANDVRLGGDVRLAIVTGSNMAGKSTYLRTAALAVLQAQMGCPVRARAMRLVPLALHANINVRDSLADGKSYFLVEVERVRDILEAAARSPYVMAVFDELFRGTNAHERLAASREIARTLATSGGLFLLATHDQGLARLAAEEAVPGIVALHFEDEIGDGRMRFPYQARPGVSRTHNAIRLLELAGYPAALVERARAHAEAAFESGGGDPERRTGGR